MGEETARLTSSSPARRKLNTVFPRTTAGGDSFWGDHNILTDEGTVHPSSDWLSRVRNRRQVLLALEGEINTGEN